MRVSNYNLTDETRAVLTDRVAKIATEMSVHTSYLYQVLSSVESDCFAKFKRLYDAAVRAGADTSPWDAAFAETRARYRRDAAAIAEVGNGFAQKIRAGGETNAAVADALADGVIDERERVVIFRAAEVERDALDQFESEIAIDGASSLRAFAKGAVSARNEVCVKKSQSD